MGKIIDISNQRFGYLTAISPTRLNGRFAWHCICDCGNEIDVDSNNLRYGKTKSCGCQKSNLISKKVSKDKTGQKIGYLTVLGPTEKRDNGGVVWKCQCDCGKICYIPTSNLSRKHTTSCGCMKYKIVSDKLKLKLLGKTFEYLTVIEELPSENYESKWLCQCKCGNTIIATGWHLTKGIVKSCGCLYSKGEVKIRELLLANNIPFEEQKIFSTCKSENNVVLKFDFYINNKYLLEYDGEQHFLIEPKGYYTSEKIQEIKNRDEIKNQWCKDNNIPLIRIPYTKYDTLTIEDLLLKE